MLKKSLFILCLLSLSGCSSAPSKMYFSPVPVTPSSNLYHGQSYNIKVSDDRRSSHLLEIHDSDGKKRFLPSGNSITDELSSRLKQGFAHQGLTTAGHGPNQIQLSIIQLEAVVAQHAVKYEASFSVEFKVTVSRQGKTHFKTFVGQSERSGPLTFDVAGIEQDLNSLAAQVLGEIYNDSYIQQSLKG